jgi:hypothetical protein
MCSDDPESAAQLSGAAASTDFQAYVKEWVGKVSSVIDQGMSH